MTNLMNRIMDKIMDETPPDVAEVIDENKDKDSGLATNIQELTQTIVMKENTKNVPHMGFSMQDLINELGIILETQMHKMALNSIRASDLGIFYQLQLVPNSFKLITDVNTGEDFYVLRNSNRMVDLYRKILKAISSSKAETISFPYFVESKLDLPVSYNTQTGDFELKSVEITSLFLVPKEVESINYSYIRSIIFVNEASDEPKSKKLIAFKIDRKELERAPYRV